MPSDPSPPAATIEQDVAQPDAPDTPTPFQDRLRAAVRGLSNDIDHRLPPGDIADLRRGSEAQLSPAFWRMLVQHVEPRDLLSEPGANGAGRRAEQEISWGVIMAAIARSKGLHDATPLGQALAHADVAEMRVMRLLNASGSALHDLVRTTTHQLISKGGSHDPLDIARLVLHDDADTLGSPGDHIRRRIARSYYRAAMRKEAQ